MSELAAQFEILVAASVAGCFATSFAKSPLFNVRVSHHPLGFRVAKIVSDNGESLRLHLWPPGSKSAQPGYEVHDHAFDFRSHVLLGGFRQDAYWVCADESGESAAYTVAYTPEGSQLMKTPGRFRLNSYLETYISQFETYRLSHETPHRIISDTTQACASLVLTEARKSHVTTFGPHDGPDLIRFPRLPTGRCAGAEYASLLANTA